MFFGAIKLNKLLFFADFLCYARTGKAITGEEYQALEHGPAPRRLKPLLTEMRKGGAVAIRPRELGGYIQNRIFALREPILEKFTTGEIALVSDLVGRFWNMTAADISKLSHGFVGWHSARLGETIPYSCTLLGSREPTPEERAYGLSLESLAEATLAS
jgi:hypothetical protein